MHHRLDTRLVACVASFIAVAAVACSAAPGTGLSTDQRDVSGSKVPGKSADNTPKTPTPTTPTDPTPTMPTAGECSAKANGDACFACCLAKSPDEYAKVNKVFDDCVCVAPGACKADCADTYCGADPSKAPSAACDTCLKANEPTCGAKADAACAASPGCQEVATCDKDQCSRFAR